MNFYTFEIVAVWARSTDGTVEDLTIDENGHAALDVVLTGSKCVTIRDIQKQATYQVTSDKEELKSFGYSMSISSESPTISLDSETGSLINPSVSEDVEVIFRNFKDAIVPTGIILDTAPYIVCICLGACGIFILRKKRNVEKTLE